MTLQTVILSLSLTVNAVLALVYIFRSARLQIMKNIIQKLNLQLGTQENNNSLLYHDNKVLGEKLQQYYNSIANYQDSLGRMEQNAKLMIKQMQDYEKIILQFDPGYEFTMSN